MCRNLDMEALDGVIFDFACGLDPYILNRLVFKNNNLILTPLSCFREPREFEFLRTLVDGAHWQGQKRLRKPDRTGRGGHIGCSEGFNFNLYKKHLPHGTNSQGREQLHAKLDKMVASLLQMTYSSFMIFLKIFFGITNLKNKKII